MRKYPEDYCLADIAAYGACILTPNHSGNHKDANGYSFNGIDKKVRRPLCIDSDTQAMLTPVDDYTYCGNCGDYVAVYYRDGDTNRIPFIDEHFAR